MHYWHNLMKTWSNKLITTGRQIDSTQLHRNDKQFCRTNAYRRQYANYHTWDHWPGSRTNRHSPWIHFLQSPVWRNELFPCLPTQHHKKQAQENNSSISLNNSTKCQIFQVPIFILIFQCSNLEYNVNSWSAT